MEKRREVIKHTKLLVDSRFQFMFEELDELSDEDIINEVIVSANILFKMAEYFGYSDKIESIIKNHYGDKL